MVFVQGKFELLCFLFLSVTTKQTQFQEASKTDYNQIPYFKQSKQIQSANKNIQLKKDKVQLNQLHL
jgi:hypothetical protein